MGIRKRIRRGLKKIARAAGGSLAGGVDAVKAAKDGKGAKGAAKAFTKSHRPGQMVEAMHDAHVETAEKIAEKVADPGIAGRVRTFGRLTRPTTPTPDPTEPILTSGSSFRAATSGNWKRAGRSLAGGAASAAMGPVEDALNKGQAIGDLVDEPSQPLDESLWPYLRRIFGDALDFYAIEVNPGRPGWGTSTDATTFPGVIYLGGNPQVDPTTPTVALTPEGMVARPGSVLVHELVHAWQSQHGGPRYLMEAVGGYAAHGEDDSYRWWNFTDDNAGSRITPFDATHGAKWRDMPPEPQAEFIQDAFDAGAFETGSYPTFAGYAARSTDFTDAADAADYAAAFGGGALIDWTALFESAVEALHKGDFRP